MKLGDTKEVFAWLPIRRMAKGPNYCKQDGWYWMRMVVVMRTFSGFVAYKDLNG